MSFDDYVAENPGLPIEILKHALNVTNNEGKRLIPHLGIAHGDIYVVGDASARLMQFAESEQQFSNLPIHTSSADSQTEASNDSITFCADYTSEQEEEPNLPLNTTSFSTVSNKKVTETQKPRALPFEEEPEQQKQLNDVSSIGKSDSKFNIKEFIQNFSAGDKPKVIPSYTGMSISASRKHKTIKLRENKTDEYFKLITYPIDHDFSHQDIQTLKVAHNRFRCRIDANMPWKDKNYLLNGTYREILTFEELFEFHKEGQTSDAARKINRIQKRYFSGVWGKKLLANYCAESFKQDYLDRTVADRQDSDRNEMIKMVNAAISKAKEKMNIQINVQELVKRGERSRADKSDKSIPKLSLLSQFITESYKLGHETLGLKLIMQFMTSTREKRTNYMHWKRIKLKGQFIEVPDHESKTGFRRHPIPEYLVKILTVEKNKQCKNKKLTLDRSNQPIWVFESPHNDGKVNTTLNTQFNEIRSVIYKNAEAQGASKKELKAIKSFTQHRIRDIVEKLLKDVGATDGQKEKCLGRLPDERSEAYGDLSIEKLSELKDEMVEKAESEFPELKALFQRLSGQPKGVMLKSSGVKKGVKNSS